MAVAPPMAAPHAQAAPAAASFYSAQQPALQQWFAAVDQDRSGKVNAAELQRALQQGGLNFSMKLINSLVRIFDADQSGQLSFVEFTGVHQWLQQLQREYSAHDTGRNNQVNLQGVQTALARMGYTLDMQPDGAFYKLCQSYDFEKSGVIGLDAFVAMCITLRNAKKVFGLFDPSGVGQVTLDFNQYVWTVAQL